MVYEVYAGGIHAVQAKLDIRAGNGRYDLVLDTATRGFLAVLAPWSGTFESHGWVMKDGSFRPELHKSAATWRGETETEEYRYSKEGGFLSYTVTKPGKMPEKKDIEAELTKGTTDAFSAGLDMLAGVRFGGDHPQKECAGAEEVFDGKRRFKQVFKNQGEENLNASKYNIYAGPALECTLEVVPVAGKWHEKPRGWMSIQEQGRERGSLPTVWVGQKEQDLLAVPVKIRVKTAYGTLFMHLAEYRSGDVVEIAEKRDGK